MTTATSDTVATDWPITFDDVRAAHARIKSYLPPTPLRHYPRLGELHA